MTCYETISALNVAARQADYRNLTAVASHISSGDAQMENELLQHAKSCVQPGILLPTVINKYERASSSFQGSKTLFTFQVNPSMAAIDSLASFPFISSANVFALKAEFPLYAAAAEDIDPSYDPLLFWKRHESDLPN